MLFPLSLSPCHSLLPAPDSERSEGSPSLLSFPTP